jgi:hypothetical protein
MRTDCAAVEATLPGGFVDHATTCVLFPHPLPVREAVGTVRLMAVVPLRLVGPGDGTESTAASACDSAFTEAVAALGAALAPACTSGGSGSAVVCVRGEVHVPAATPAQLAAVAACMEAGGVPSTVRVARPGDGEAVGYALHALAHRLTVAGSAPAS